MKLTTKDIDLLAGLAKASARLLISKKEAVLFRSRESVNGCSVGRLAMDEKRSGESGATVYENHEECPAL